MKIIASERADIPIPGDANGLPKRFFLEDSLNPITERVSAAVGMGSIESISPEI